MQKKNLFIFVILSLILSINLIIAPSTLIGGGRTTEPIRIPTEKLIDRTGQTWDNVVSTISKTDILTEEQIKQIDEGASKYPAIDITNALGLGETLMEAVLEKHTASCGINCMSQFEITINQDSPLVTDVKFNKLLEDNVTWVNSYIRSYKFSILSELKQREVEDYKWICTPTGETDKNGTKIETCDNKLVGTHFVDDEVWIDYPIGTVMPSGTYTIKLEGNKRAEWTYDWIITSQGKEISNWAVWGNIPVEYDNFTGSVINSSKWQNTSAKTAWGGEDASVIQYTGNITVLSKCASDSACSASSTLNSLLLNYSNIDTLNIIMTLSYATTGCDSSYGGTHSYAGFSLFGTEIDRITSPCTQPSTYTGSASKVLNWNFIKINSTHWSANNGTTTTTFAVSNNNLTLFSSNGGVSSSTAIAKISYIAYNVSSIILNSPAPDYISPTNLVTFNATATVVGGATLTNMSLWDNSTGVWKVNQSILYNGIYDNYPVASINTSLWATTLGTGCSNNIVTDTSLDLSCGGGDFGTSGSGSTIGYNIPSTLNNISFSYTLTTSTGGGNGAGNSDIYVFGSVIDGLSDGIGSPHGTTTRTRAVYLIKNGMNYDLYLDNVFNKTITPSNYNITLNAGWSAVGDGGQGIAKITKISYYGGINSAETSIFTNTLTKSTLWSIQACDSDGDCGFSENSTVYIDTTPPSISILYPTGTINGLTNGQSLDLNYTVFDNNLDSCWYEYNGINDTNYSCLNKTFTYASGVNTIKVWANDSVANLGSGTSSWTTGTTIGTVSFNSSTYETSTETFYINGTSITSANLIYNGTSYPMSVSGSSATKELTLSSIGNKSFYFSINSGVFNTSLYYQNVLPINFTICNTTGVLSIPYINFTFKDENTLDYINASIQSSQFDYYLGDGSVKKTYLYQNNTENSNYAFCASPSDRTFNVIPSITYSSTGYPSRLYNPSALSLTNSTTNEVLYLLDSASGIYTTFITSSVSNTPISGVNINIIRTISGSNVTIGNILTDSSGSATFFLNPNFEHTITATKTGYLTSVTTLRPTQPTYTIIMSLAASNSTYLTVLDGVTYQIGPKCGIINENSIYSVYFNVQSSLCNLQSYNIDITNKSGFIYATTNGTNPCGSNLNISFNTTGYGQLFGRYYINAGNGTLLVDPCMWYIKDIQEGNSSITHAIRDLLNYRSNIEDNYAQIFWFFLFLFLGLAAFNFYTNADIQNPGNIIIPICIIITIFSVMRFFLIDFTPYTYMNQYAVAVVCWCLGLGFWLGRMQSQ